MKAVFFQLTEVGDKSGALLTRGGASAFSIDPQSFRALPSTPFSYWERPGILNVFGTLPSLDSTDLSSRQGLATADDFRFVRLWWEVRPPNRYRVFAKGGVYSTYYADCDMAVDLASGRRQMEASLNDRGETKSNVWMLAGTIRNFFGRPGLRWTRTALGGRRQGLGLTILGAGGAFNDKSCALFVDDDDTTRLLASCALLSSAVVDRLMRVISPTRSWEVGHVRTVPVPILGDTTLREAAELASRCWTLKRSTDTSAEDSHAFASPAALQSDRSCLTASAHSWSSRLTDARSRLRSAESRIDELFFDAYELSPEDRMAIVADMSEERDAGDVSAVEVDPAVLAAGLVSWCVGVAVGRFDVRLATGEREWPEEPNPFDPLPACSPGMLTGEDGLPLEVAPAGYPVDVSPVLVHDPGHRLDITAQVRSVFDVVFGANTDGWWSDVGTSLGGRDREVGSWLSRGFFDHHLRTYSKSRRKAPVLWPLGTKSGSYLVWLYGHRVTGDSLFRVLNDVVSPKLVLERRRLADLAQEAGANPSASQRKAIDGQEKFVDELQQFVADLTAVAPLWHPDLNDGVVVVLAPLRRLFAHHRPWLEELTAHWESLLAGEYDWTQVAMCLWPERVVPKCAEDRSLAIAHGLEDVFWVQDDASPEKWYPRQIPTVAVEQLIADRADAPTKAALEDEAP